jgi:hypothetical protein
MPVSGDLLRFASCRASEQKSLTLRGFEPIHYFVPEEAKPTFAPVTHGPINETSFRHDKSLIQNRLSNPFRINGNRCAVGTHTRNGGVNHRQIFIGFCVAARVGQLGFNGLLKEDGGRFRCSGTNNVDGQGQELV